MTPDRIRPPLKWHGGKYVLAANIVALFPAHKTYVEPFGGSASVLLNKTSAAVEIFNDLDQDVVNLFRVLRNDSDTLKQRLTLTPYAETEFVNAALSAKDDVERARRFIVRFRQSLGGRGDSFARSSKERVVRGMADNVSAWLSTIDEELPRIVERLRRVEISCRPAVEIIRKYDLANALFYCDPPYVPSTRAQGCRDVYKHEMTDDDHRALAKVLNACRGKVMLSGYDSPLYRDLYSSWNVVTFDVACHAGVGKKKSRRREILWLNFPVREVGKREAA